MTAKVPELLSLAFFLPTQQTTSCAVNEPWLTTARGLVSHRIPKIAVSVSSCFRSEARRQPDAGAQLLATYGPSLGANTNVFVLPGGLAPGEFFKAVNLVLPGQVYGDRINGIDLRFGKLLRFGRTRTLVGLDLYNLMNRNTGTTYNQTYDSSPTVNGATWLRPTAIMNPRFVRFNVTVDF